MQIAAKKEFVFESGLEASWQAALADEFHHPYFKKLTHFVLDDAKQHKIYPTYRNVFNAFACTPLDQVKVVILGQDPYHGAGQAHGLAFSVLEGCPPPPSLQNIFKELETDCQCQPPKNGDLTHWAKQGVLLLNTVLTVRAGQAHSHRDQGWEKFTDAVIKKINQSCQHVVFLLWGSPAQAKASMIDSHRHLILRAPHPSPLSAYRGFMGCKHFSKTNAYLLQHHIRPIDWQL